MSKQSAAAKAANDRAEASGLSQFDTLPRRILTLYLPLFVFVFVLLFPFYWMVITAVKPDNQLTDYQTYSPFWVVGPTLEHIKYLLFETSYPGWLWNTMVVAVCSTFLALAASVFAAYAIERIRFTGARVTGLMIFLAYLVPPSILFIPLAFIVFQVGIFDSMFALILTYPTFLIPFCTWLLMGYFRTIPFELEESALVDGATRWQILTKVVLPLAVPGLIFLAARDAAGTPVAMGALKLLDGSEAEIKSMHVLAEHRGRGLSRLMLAALLDLARDRGIV
ncbi:carbohydrate ABC transporter permease, partial [Aurantimonas coralicida]|uniref:carbohydrate ABC transporter permease n=1 Tax=Aurantimonas coralicida TaxID=182270 RepID=UPI002396D7AA